MTTYAVPKTFLAPPQFRVLYRSSFGASEVIADDRSISATNWVTLSQPSQSAGIQTGGVELISIKRKALPEIGTAEFRYVYGKLIGGTVPRPTSFTVASGGTSTSLEKFEVRLQMRPHASVSAADWKTYFWGYVDLQEDEFFAGSAILNGSIVFRCVDGFARTAKWMMNRHGVDPDNVTGGPNVIPELYGNPGYNYQLTTDGPILGNKSPWIYYRGGQLVHAHSWQGAFAVANSGDPVAPTQSKYKWAEYESLVHACSASRPDGEPFFDILHGDQNNFNNFTPITTSPLESVHSFVSRVTSRNRGLGVVIVDWQDLISGAIQVGFRYCPLFKDDFTYILPSTGLPAPPSDIVGANSAGTAYFAEDGAQLLYLQGDQRILDSYTKFSDAETNLYDYVETIGEQIRVVATLSYADQYPGTIDDIYDQSLQVSLAPRWTESDADTFVSPPSVTGADIMGARTMPYWDHVWQAHGIPRNWTGEVGDGGFAGSSHRADYGCGDNGQLIAPLNTDPHFTSPVMTEILGDMPLFIGYRYDGTYPERTDNSQEFGSPSMRNLQVYLNVKTSVDRWFLPGSQLPSVLPAGQFYNNSSLPDFNPEISLHSDAILSFSRQFMQQGQRLYGDLAGEAGLDDEHKVGVQYNITQLAFTVGLKLPNYVRLASTTVSAYRPGWSVNQMKDWTLARRKKTIQVPACHFWLIDYGAIYDLDALVVATDDGFEPLRNGLGSSLGSPGILRDDRDRLARYHAIISNWYMTPRRRLNYALETCAFIPSKVLKNGTTLVDEVVVKLGDYIHQTAAAGQTIDVGTCITSMEYDHQRGVTVIQTDWFELEVNI